MKRLYVYCEGQTEENFVKTLLFPHFIGKDIYVIPIICRTKESPQGIHKGGIVDYKQAVKEIKRLCSMHKNEYVTSFIDYYGLNNFPKTSDLRDKYALISSVEERFKKDVGCDNFIPYISLHEFESLLFSDPTKFEYLNKRAVSALTKILNEFEDNPEFINNGKATAPSKRIAKEIDNYGKVIDGNRIAKNITLPKIRQKCKHFSAWLSRLEAL